jgi:hypothetical protein
LDSLEYFHKNVDLKIIAHCNSFLQWIDGWMVWYGEMKWMDEYGRIVWIDEMDG